MQRMKEMLYQSSLNRNQQKKDWFTAAKNGDIQTLTRLMPIIGDINIIDDKADNFFPRLTYLHKSALTYAAEAGHLHAVQHLIQAGAKVGSDNALLFALNKNRKPIVDFILNLPIVLSENVLNSSLNSVIENYNDDAKLLIAILSKGVSADNLNTYDSGFDGHLFRACELGRPECADALIKWGANVNLQYTDKWINDKIKKIEDEYNKPYWNENKNDYLQKPHRYIKVTVEKLSSTSPSSLQKLDESIKAMANSLGFDKYIDTNLSYYVASRMRNINPDAAEKYQQVIKVLVAAGANLRNDDGDYDLANFPETENLLKTTRRSQKNMELSHSEQQKSAPSISSRP